MFWNNSLEVCRSVSDHPTSVSVIAMYARAWSAGVARGWAGRLYAKHDFCRGVGGLHSLPGTKAPTPPNSPSMAYWCAEALGLALGAGYLCPRTRAARGVCECEWGGWGTAGREP